MGSATTATKVGASRDGGDHPGWHASVGHQSARIGGAPGTFNQAGKVPQWPRPKQTQRHWYALLTSSWGEDCGHAKPGGFMALPCSMPTLG